KFTISLDEKSLSQDHNKKKQLRHLRDPIDRILKGGESSDSRVHCTLAQEQIARSIRTGNDDFLVKGATSQLGHLARILKKDQCKEMEHMPHQPPNDGVV
ncbi:hypothetical protein KEM56_005977, partial [Ascosphaera pollenicola]